MKRSTERNAKKRELYYFLWLHKILKAQKKSWIEMNVNEKDFHSESVHIFSTPPKLNWT
jgi:hypothetical protein